MKTYYIRTVEVFTMGGTFTVDVTESHDQGLLEDHHVTTAGAMMDAVQGAFRNGINLLDLEGNPIRIHPRFIIGVGYKRILE
jgi:hypothetical protein